ncbi:hypothetical protein R5R35_008037 [Gryllus longicercus]|uniref:Uncharacterized protein n=1 Tax=Gryllus longicercus TaxID=2509291 RepID=A0AAN9VVZ6_9ORTH
MPEYNIMPAKCCCCSLQTASIVVGIFSLIFALIFMGVTAAFSNGLGRASCSTTCMNYNCTSKCTPPSEAEKMVSNLLAILAVINAVEVIMSIGMIWGASKRILPWVTGWLVVSASWMLLHGTIALSFLFASSDPGVVVLVSVLGIIILGMAILAFLTILSLRNEMTNAVLFSTINDSPTALLSHI